MPNKKGIVLESNDGWSTVLMEGGQYKKVPGSLEVGSEYAAAPNKIALYSKYAAAAAVLLLILLGTIDYFNVVAYANVSTGVEMGVNRWSRVVSVNYRSDSELSTAKDLSLKGQKVEDAVAMVVQAAGQADDAPAVQIEVKSERKNNRQFEKIILEKVETSISDMRQENHGKSSYQRKGRVIEIEEPEKLVPPNSSARNTKRPGNNKTNSYHPNQKDTANDKNNQKEQPKLEPEAGQPEGQVKKDQESESQKRSESANQGKTVPANNKARDDNNGSKNSRNNSQTEYQKNSKDDNHKNPAFNNDSGKADKNSGRPFTKPQN